MEKILVVRTSKQDYDAVMNNIIRRHAKGYIRVVMTDDYNEIIAAVNWFKMRNCVKDIGLAKALGIDVVIIKDES